MSRIVDLDAARAARLEAADDAPIVKLGGQDFGLPTEIPIGVALHGEAGEIKAALGALFGPENVDAVLAAGLTAQDLEVIVSEAYGTKEEK